MAAQQFNPDELGSGSGDDQPSESPVTMLKRAVFRFPLTIAGTTVIGAAAAFVVAFSKPNTYRSEGMLLLRTGAREQLTPERAVDIQTNNDRSVTATEEELLLLSDPSLADRVVERIGADRIVAPYDPMANDDERTPPLVRTVHELQAWLMSLGATQDLREPGASSESVQSQAAAVVRANRQLFVIPQTDVISVSYAATDPVLARDVAAAFLSILREVHQEFFASKDIVAFVRTQLGETVEIAEAARTALEERKTADGVFDYETAVTALEGEVRRLKEQDEEDSLQIEGLNERLATARAQLEEIDGQIAESTAETLESQDEVEPMPLSSSVLTVETARERILAEEQAIEALAAEFATSSPRYQAKAARHRAEIERLKTTLDSLIQIERERDRVLAERERAARPVGTTVESLLRSERAEVNSSSREYAQQLDGLEVIVTERRVLLEEKTARLEALRSRQPEYMELNAAVEDAEDRVSELRGALARAETLELIGLDERMVNLQVIRQPIVPHQKEGSSRLKMLLLGLIAGAGAGFAIACGRLLLDPMLRYRGEIEGQLGLPVVGVIPSTRSWRAFGRSTRLHRSAS